MLRTEEIINALEAKGCRPKRVGNRWLALCPAHDDHRPSLSITEKDNRALVYCFAGCSYESIIQALDLNCGEPEATYSYTDENGRLLFQVLRYRGKRFKQRRPDGRGGWVYSLNGTRRVLYRLPQVIEAVAQGKTIFIVEGEKDVDNLIKLGLTATTAPGGAGPGKWRPEYNEWLKGANVVIVPDNDEVGRAYAHEIANSLLGVASSVKVVELPGLPEKGDISDWLELGHTKEELLALAERSPEWGLEGIVTIDELRERFSSSFDFLWRQHLPAGYPVMLAGREGTGKTTIALQIAKEILDTDPEARIVWFPLEGSIKDFLRKVDDLNIPPRLLVAKNPRTNDFSFNFDLKEDLAHLEKILRKAKPRLVVMDSLRRVSRQEIKSEKFANTVIEVNGICEKHGVTIIFIHHLNKADRANDLDRLLGSVTLPASMRLVYLVKKNGATRRRVVCIKDNPGVEPPELEVLKTHKGIFIYETQDPEEKTAIARAEKFLVGKFAEKPEWPACEIYREAESLGIGPSSLKKVKNELGIKSERRYGRWFWMLNFSNSLTLTEKCSVTPQENVNLRESTARGLKGRVQGFQGFQGFQEEQEDKMKDTSPLRNKDLNATDPGPAGPSSGEGSHPNATPIDPDLADFLGIDPVTGEPLPPDPEALASSLSDDEEGLNRRLRELGETSWPKHCDTPEEKRAYLEYAKAVNELAEKRGKAKPGKPRKMGFDKERFMKWLGNRAVWI